MRRTEDQITAEIMRRSREYSLKMKRRRRVAFGAGIPLALLLCLGTARLLNPPSKSDGSPDNFNANDWQGRASLAPGDTAIQEFLQATSDGAIDGTQYPNTFPEATGAFQYGSESPSPLPEAPESKMPLVVTISRFTVPGIPGVNVGAHGLELENISPDAIYECDSETGATLMGLLRDANEFESSPVTPYIYYQIHESGGVDGYIEAGSTGYFIEFTDADGNRQSFVLVFGMLRMDNGEWKFWPSDTYLKELYDIIRGVCE